MRKKKALINYKYQDKQPQVPNAYIQAKNSE